MKIKIIFYKFDVLEIIIIFQTIVEKKKLNYTIPGIFVDINTMQNKNNR